MLIIVTGNIGIGKSTVCRKVINEVYKARYACGGIITTKALDGGIIVEDIQTGQQMILASADSEYQGPRIGKYSFNPLGFAFGIDAINKGMGLSLLVIDELGPLELAGEGLTGAVQLLREEKAGSRIVVIRKELLSSFLPLFDSTPLVFETTVSNRNHLWRQIGQIIIDALNKS